MAEADQKKLKLYSFCGSSCSFRGFNTNIYLLIFSRENSDSRIHQGQSHWVCAGPGSWRCWSDSLAILMYLEDKYPQHPLLPSNLHKRAIHYQKYVWDKFGADEELSFARDHIGKGFEALEKLLRGHAGRYATGDEVFLADLFLAPQIYAAIKRFNIDMVQVPLLARLNDAYNVLPAFQDAIPEKQPDAPPSVAR
ncbi:hypothetical protein SLE2022_211930 [Rubroshorea leprosula]